MGKVTPKPTLCLLASFSPAAGGKVCFACLGGVVAVRLRMAVQHACSTEFFFVNCAAARQQQKRNKPPSMPVWLSREVVLLETIVWAVYLAKLDTVWLDTAVFLPDVWLRWHLVRLHTPKRPKRDTFFLQKIQLSGIPAWLGRGTVRAKKGVLNVTTLSLWASVG